MYTMSCQVMSTVFLLMVVLEVEVVEVVQAFFAVQPWSPLPPSLSGGQGDHVHSLRPRGDLG